MAWWKYKKYLQMGYALYLAGLTVWCVGLLLSSGADFARRRWLN